MDRISDHEAFGCVLNGMSMNMYERSHRSRLSKFKLSASPDACDSSSQTCESEPTQAEGLAAGIAAWRQCLSLKRPCCCAGQQYELSVDICVALYLAF